MMAINDFNTCFRIVLSDKKLLMNRCTYVNFHSFPKLEIRKSKVSDRIVVEINSKFCERLGPLFTIRLNVVRPKKG